MVLARPHHVRQFVDVEGKTQKLAILRSQLLKSSQGMKGGLAFGECQMDNAFLVSADKLEPGKKGLQNDSQDREKLGPLVEYSMRWSQISRGAQA